MPWLVPRGLDRREVSKCQSTASSRNRVILPGLTQVSTRLVLTSATLRLCLAILWSCCRAKGKAGLSGLRRGVAASCWSGSALCMYFPSHRDRRSVRCHRDGSEQSSSRSGLVSSAAKHAPLDALRSGRALGCLLVASWSLGLIVAAIVDDFIEAARFLPPRLRSGTTQAATNAISSVRCYSDRCIEKRECTTKARNGGEEPHDRGKKLLSTSRRPRGQGSPRSRYRVRWRGKKRNES